MVDNPVGNINLLRVLKDLHALLRCLPLDHVEVAMW